MHHIIAARAQMGLSLGFHIIFACIGMVMPFFMAYSHWLWLSKGNITYQNITRAWSQGVAIFFVTGAVSGTMLSFELGLLWPRFMLYAGPIIGMPFSFEGIAFFIEAIAIGFFLYGWNRLNRWFHWFCGLLTGLSGLASGILVVAANSWMNTPAGFVYSRGKFTHIRPIQAMFNQAWLPESLHMVLAAFAATGFAVAGIHALMVYRNRNPDFHWKAFRIAISFAAIAAILQPFSGDFAARTVAKTQPAKLAAMEADYHTMPYSPLLIGGIPDPSARTVKYGIEIPGMLSFLVHDDPRKPVTGLDHFPVNDQPPVAVLHNAFQIMVAIGFFLMALGIIYLAGSLKKKAWLKYPWFLKLCMAATPLGFVAIEAGWIDTEVGRQPWIIYHIMKTADAVTPMPGIRLTFLLFTFIYLLLSIAVVILIVRQIRAVPMKYDLPGPSVNK